MAQLQKGTTYITGDQVTAANLNALVDSGILTPGAVTDQTAKTVPLAADTILLHSAADTALRKTTMTQLFATPQPLGATTPSSVAATTGTFSSTLGVTGVATLGNGAILGTPASGTVTNLTGTASININGTVGATTPSTGAFSTLSATSTTLVNGATGTSYSYKGLHATGPQFFGYDNVVGNGYGGGVRGYSVTSQGGYVALGTIQNNTWSPALTIDHINASTFASNVAITGTLSATGDITSSGGNILSTVGTEIPIRVSGATTGATVLRLQNTGGSSFFGAEGTNTSNYIVGCTAYDTLVRGPSGIAFSANAGNAMQMRISSAGAAITGTLSSTGNLSTTGDLRVTDTGSSHFILIGNQDSGGANKPNIIRGVNGTLSLGYGTSWSSSGGGTLTSIADISSTGLAVTGTLSATGSAAFGIGIQPSIRIASFSEDQSSSTYSLVCYDGNGFSKFSVRGDGAVAVAGALSKGSGSFRIEHPLPSKSATHQLVHSFIEGPKCDLIYRGKIDLVDGKASVNIDADSTMTEGTFEALCATVQCFTSNESGWGAIRGKVVGNILTIEAQDAASTDNVSWMVIGERKDKHIMDTDWTDKNGRPIVEPLKPAEPALEAK